MSREFTLEEVARHNTERDCFVVVKGIVLDVTDYLATHPGGKNVPYIINTQIYL